MTLFLRIASLYLAIDFFKLAIAGLYHANKSQNCEFVSRNDDKKVRIASLYHAMMIKSQKKKLQLPFYIFSQWRKQASIHTCIFKQKPTQIDCVKQRKIKKQRKNIQKYKNLYKNTGVWLTWSVT